jgi:hypothetical protein
MTDERWEKVRKALPKGTVAGFQGADDLAHLTAGLFG